MHELRILFEGKFVFVASSENEIYIGKKRESYEDRGITTMLIRRMAR